MQEPAILSPKPKIKLKKDTSARSQAGAKPTWKQKQAQPNQQQDAHNAENHDGIPVPPTRISINIQGERGLQHQCLALLDNGAKRELDVP